MVKRAYICICVCAYMCVCVFICIYIYTYTEYVCIYTPCMYMHIYIYPLCIHTCTCTLCVHIHVYPVYIWTHIHHVCVYLSIYTLNVHTHTHIPCMCVPTHTCTSLPFQTFECDFCFATQTTQQQAPWGPLHRGPCTPRALHRLRWLDLEPWFSTLAVLWNPQGIVQKYWCQVLPQRLI